MNDTIAFGNTTEEEEAILPEGWTGEVDIFNLSDDGDDFFADEQEATPVVDTETDEEPTTAPEFGTPVPNEAASSTEENTPHTTEAETPAAEQRSTKLRFKARVDHDDQDVEIDESDLPAIYQKSMVTDRYQKKMDRVNPMLERLERMAKNNGYDTVEAMLDAQETYDRDAAIEKLVQQGTPKVIAEDYYDRTYGRTAQQTAQTSTPEVEAETVEGRAPAQSENPPARDFASEVKELWSMRPDLKGTKIPSEVAAAAANGQNLALAFFAYEAKQAKATAEQLRQENNTYKQNAASAAKAPVKGVSGGGSTNTEPEDPFLKGFNSDW